MTKSELEQDDGVIFSLSDLGLLCRRNKGKILLGSLSLTLLVAFYVLSKPVVYEAEATFREKEKNSSGLNGSIGSMLGFSSMTRQGNEAIALMQSRKLMEPVVKELGLQAVVSRKKDPKGLVHTIRNNVRAQLGHFKRSSVPVLPDPHPLLRCSEVEYTAEVPQSLQVIFTASDRFELHGEGDDPIEGRLGEYIQLERGGFALEATDEEVGIGERFTLTLLPLPFAAEGYAKSITIEPDEDDGSLLKLEFSHPDRHFASHFLNVVMANYQEYLIAQNDRRAQQQLAYLKRRQSDSARDLEELLTEHAATLSSDVAQTGFPDSDKEMNFLAHAQQHNKRRLMALELELKRIDHAKSGDDLLYDTLLIDNEPRTFTGAISEIRGLKQRRDSLELALRQIEHHEQRDLREAFELQIEELHEVVESRREAEVLLASLEKDEPLNSDLTLSRDPRWLVSEWIQRLEQSVGREKGAPEWARQSLIEEQDRQRDNFAAYLRNLVRSFSVQARTIEERLTHQQNPQLAYQGIDLKTAEQLYVSYQGQLSGLEAQIRQNLDILDQMRDPSFDITSLSVTLNDPISTEMMQESSRVILQLRDQSNRTEKEQTRLQDTLHLQREFLTSHVRQQTHLHQLQEKLLQEKTESLMRTMLDLSHREITILEKHVNDFIGNRQLILSQEEQLLNLDLGEIRHQMAELPKRWVTEQMIALHMAHSQLTVEEVSKLVESKNIAHNLEVIESAPVDQSIAPILPRDPKLFLFLTVGVTLGFFLSTTFVILKGIATGVPVSSENLRLLGQHVSGFISKRSEKVDTQNLSNLDLETLRKLINFLPLSDTGPKRILLSMGEGPKYARHLTKLLKKKGKKSLVVEASFDRAADPKEQPGLLQVLEKEAQVPLILSEESHDRIAAGGISRYSAELLGSVGFETLLRDLEQEYDYVFLVHEGTAFHAETLQIFERSHAAAITVMFERLDDLKPFTHCDRHQICSFLVFNQV